jgi:proline-specific peptidase
MTPPSTRVFPSRKARCLFKLPTRPSRLGIGFVADCKARGSLPSLSCTAGRELRSTLAAHYYLGLIHDYVLPISDLAKAGDRAVIFYDQLGNGRSTHLRDKPAEFWTIELFIDELVNLTTKLGISSCFDLCGHSWGGMLGIEYLIRCQPANLRRFICSNTPASIPGYVQDVGNMLSKFPKWVQECWDKKNTNYECFRAAQDAFDAVHTINVVPFPKEHVDSLDSVYGPNADGTVIETM